MEASLPGAIVRPPLQGFRVGSSINDAFRAKLFHRSSLQGWLAAAWRLQGGVEDGDSAAGWCVPESGVLGGSERGRWEGGGGRKGKEGGKGLRGGKDAIERPSNAVLAAAELDCETWAGEVKRVRGPKQPLTAAGVRTLRVEYTRTIEPARFIAAETLKLERSVRDLVNPLCG